MSSTEGPEALRGLCADLKRLHVECHRLTLDNLADVCHLSRAQVGTILNGHIRRLPDLDVVLAIVQKCASYAADHGISLSLSTAVDYWRKAHGSVERSLAGQQIMPPKQVARDPWIDLVEENSGDDALGRQAIVVAKHLAAERHAAAKKLKGDPWLDPDLACRVVDHAITLATEFLDEDTKLSASETALLVIAPLLHHVTWLKAAAQAEINPLDLSQTGSKEQNRAGFERFLRGRQQQRLVTRATQRGLADRSADSAEIGWWLLHRWLDTHQPDTRASTPLESVIEDRRLRGMLLDPLHRLVRVFRLSVGELSSAERLDLPAKYGDSLGTPGVRVRLIGLILVVAHSLAVEIAALPSTVVEHLGIPESVRLDELQHTLKNSEWRRGGSDLSLWLHAECRHEAVLEALTEHVGRIDTLLGSVRAIAQHDVTLQPLRALPTRACTDQIRPASVNGAPMFTVPVARFRLDETRVRELLMGEQLYRDRSLAVRELYQNALDACRYRKARHEFQEKTWGWHSDWEGNIYFDQGIDSNGRRYLRCRDNGVGMSELDLREVFSQAGIRFADRHEFAEEQADWDKCGVEFYPNSRFGIGVLSYFMIADEIEVTTCRMSRQAGAPGPLLQVAITGPGHLFRIKQIAEHGSAPGTEVKVYLRSGEESLSCVQTLRALLGIAEFATRAEHDGVFAEWKPFCFQPRERQTWEPHGINAYGHLEPATKTKHGQVIWCEHGGALLADGIYVQAKDKSHGFTDHFFSMDPRGAVINLTGSSAPKLTVDRMSVIDDVSGQIFSLLGDSTKSLMMSTSSLLSYQWLLSVSFTSPRIADLVTAAAARTGKTLEMGSKRIEVHRSGVLLIDVALTEQLKPEADKVSWSYIRNAELDHILLWRLLALVDNPLGGCNIDEPDSIRPALPSDILLTGEWKSDRSYAFNDGPPTIGIIAKKAHALDCEVDAIIHRMRLLGLHDKVDISHPFPKSADATDVVLVSDSLNGEHPWLSQEKPVTLANVIAASARTQLPPSQVVTRLESFGYFIESTNIPVTPIDSSDLRLVSKNLDSKWPWLDTNRHVTPLHSVRAAKLAHQSFTGTMERLTNLGFRVLEPKCRLGELDILDPPTHAAIEHLTSLYMTTSCSRLSVIKAAAEFNLSPAHLGKVLDNLRVNVEGIETLPSSLEHNDKEILKNALLGRQGVHLGKILDISSKTGIPPEVVRDRMLTLGFELKFPVEVLENLDDLSYRIARSPILYAFGIQLTPTIASVIRLAARFGESITRVGNTLKNLGFNLPETAHLPDQLTESDISLLSVDPPPGFYHSIPITKNVPLAHIARVSHESKVSPKAAAERLRQLGYRVPPAETIPTQFTQETVRLLSWSSFTRKIWLDCYEPVTIGDLIRAAIRCNISLPAAAEAMMNLGLETPDLEQKLPPLLAKVPLLSGDSM